MYTIVRKYHPLDFETDVGIGIKLPYSNTYTTQTVSGSYQNPLREGSVSLFELTYNTSDQILYNLINLVLTKKGERVMHPTFGTSIYSYLFEPIDTTLKSRLKESLHKDIKYWMPYLLIETIDVVDDTIDENKLRIKISFRTNEYDEVKTIDFTFGNTIEYNIL